ncbi:MAG TPA: hypothetical protein VF981_02835 [Gemmatimonadaceae bacterium]
MSALTGLRDVSVWWTYHPDGREFREAIRTQSRRRATARALHAALYAGREHAATSTAAASTMRVRRADRVRVERPM